MRAAILLCVSFCSVLATEAGAETFVVNAAIGTTAAFDCRSSIVCSGEGTDTITFGSGDNTGTLKFTGASSAFAVTNKARQVTLGSVEFTATDGFTFPTHPTNAGLPILRFLLFANHSLPTVTTQTKSWLMGPGGGSSLTLQSGRSVIAFPSTVAQYPLIVYTVNPFPFTLEPNSTFTLTADVGAVPEPASMLLFGTGLVGAAMARRRRAKREQAAGSLA